MHRWIGAMPRKHTREMADNNMCFFFVSRLAVNDSFFFAFLFFEGRLYRESQKHNSVVKRCVCRHFGGIIEEKQNTTNKKYMSIDQMLAFNMHIFLLSKYYFKIKAKHINGI